jgi:Pyruvate/2-oxoacid:ferredoxin oxidoreductase delta subunit
MPVKNLFVFYFSGTGNARFISEIIIEQAIEKGMQTKLIDISDTQTPGPEIPDDTIIGFCSPTHGFNMPPIMLKFIRDFKRNKYANVKVFVLNTRAGMKLYKLFTPGLSGIALLLPALMLRLKGFGIIGLQPMDMPSNWISLHPGIREKVIKSITNRCARKTKRFADRILAGKKVFKGLISLPIDLAVLPIAILYYFIGRFMLAKTFIASDKCNSCGLCIKECPVKAILEIKGINYWSFSCESCMKCMNACPNRAIETAHGFTFALWWLILSVISVKTTIFLLDLTLIKKFPEVFHPILIENIVSISVSFLTVYFAYKLLNFLLKFKIFNRLFTYTSFTKLRFWRRYKFIRKIFYTD